MNQYEAVMESLSDLSAADREIFIYKRSLAPYRPQGIYSFSLNPIDSIYNPLYNSVTI